MKKQYQQIIKKLIKKKYTLSLSESCTGGKLSSAITSVSGISNIYDFGLVAYSNKSKKKINKVNSSLIAKHGAVSYEVCKSMLEGLAKLSSSKIKIAITGVAGPKGGGKNKPVGLVFIGIKYSNKIIINKYKFKNQGRNFIQKQAVNKVFNLLSKII